MRQGFHAQASATFRAALGSALLASLAAGCSAQRPPSASATPADLSTAAATPCNEAAPMSYPTPNDAADPVEPKLSHRALASKRNGCAGVKFQIASDGSVRNAQLVSESPTGLGFGQSAIEALRATRFGPDQPKSDWFYVNTVYMQMAAQTDRMPYIDPTMSSTSGIMDRNPNRP